MSSYTIGKYKSSGSASEFYMLTGSKTRGFKSFDSYDSASIAHYNQRELASLNLAPRVYSDVGRIRKDKSLTGWGYITEVAITLGCGGNSCSCCDRDELEDEYGDEISNLVDAMEEHGFYFNDCHSGNIGFVRRAGQMVMVCIDTGEESVSCDHSPCSCLICKKGGNCRE